MKKILVLISGNGSNLQAILDSCGSIIKQSQVCAVLSNDEQAYGLERAKAAGVDSYAIDPKKFNSRTDFDHELMRQIDAYQPDLIVLAGFMRILTDDFVQHYLGRMINIHPSLLPKYTGLHTHSRVIEAGESEHGTSVHFVTPELDGGPVILQAKVPVFSEDTPETLKERVQCQEHNIYPLTISWFMQGRLSMQAGKAILDGVELGKSGYAAD